MRFILASFSWFALASAWTGDASSSPDFSKYQHPLFTLTMESETHSGIRNSNVLVVIEFCNNGDGATRWSVDESGIPQCAYLRLFAIGGVLPRRRLSQTEIGTLMSAVRELPATNALPSIDDLIIVRFRQGTNWIMRSYDKHNLSKPMRQIRDLMRSPAWQQSFTVS